MASDFKNFKERGEKIAEWLQREFLTIQTGRASSAFLDKVAVESYGTLMPVNQVASINVEDARTLRIMPWDASLLRAIEKAIMSANLGVSVSVDDKGIRIFFPEPTAERRVGLVKLIKEKHEEARVSLRTLREEFRSDIALREKEGTIGEDEKFRQNEELQKLTDEANRKLDEMAEKKEGDIMNI